MPVFLAPFYFDCQLFHDIYITRTKNTHEFEYLALACVLLFSTLVGKLRMSTIITFSKYSSNTAHYENPMEACGLSVINICALPELPHAPSRTSPPPSVRLVHGWKRDDHPYPILASCSLTFLNSLRRLLDCFGSKP